MKWLCIIFFSLFLSLSLFAQTDSIVENKPSTFIDTTKKHSPTTATILSAACPGLGQIYNKNYWKVPIIYAGFIGLGYGIQYHNNYYQEFKSVYDSYRANYLDKGITLPSDTTFSVLDASGYYIQNVKDGRDHFRRNRDLCIIGAGTWYILNILEAYVYANLYDFDTDDDLSFRIEPMYYISQYKPVTGIRFTMRF